jgi:cytochrome P450
MVQDLFVDADTLNDPYGYFALLREEAPVFFSKSVNAYTVTRYSDVQYVLQNPAIFSSSAGESKHLIANFTAEYFPIYEAAGTPTPMPTLVVTDGSVHQRYRKLVDSTFNAVSVNQLHPNVESLVEMLIDGIFSRGEVGVGRRGLLC